nr:MAG TPA: hypothetical protein [Caudoviricetes sp.]DAY81771.1 MAG TPA: hypothetical protein [Caudoviricetes sp.]
MKKINKQLLPPPIKTAVFIIGNIKEVIRK